MRPYNTVSVNVKCAHCQDDVDLTVFVCDHIGELNCTDYTLGETVHWEPASSTSRGTRPAKGNIDATGWSECPDCCAEYSPRVKIRSDVIQAVELETA